MSQRSSGYQRIKNDSYPTPAWVTDALIPHLPAIDGLIWEPAAGSGQMVAALRKAGCKVIASDIDDGHDFLTQPALKTFRGIVTNPPYELATEFIEHAIAIVPAHGFVAMLLRTDFDHAQSRRHFFAGCPLFAQKLVLTKRIRWFDRSKGGPSYNHAWWTWDRTHRGPPTLAYGP